MRDRYGAASRNILIINILKFTPRLTACSQAVHIRKKAFVC
jgi:hypothetical protein